MEASDLTTKVLEQIDQFFGEDTGDLMYLLKIWVVDNEDAFLYAFFDEKVLTVYWGDHDVKNSVVIFAEEPKKVRWFCSENAGMEIRSLWDILINIDESLGLSRFADKMERVRDATLKDCSPTRKVRLGGDERGDV